MKMRLRRAGLGDMRRVVTIDLTDSRVHRGHCVSKAPMQGCHTLLMTRHCSVPLGLG